MLFTFALVARLDYDNISKPLKPELPEAYAHCRCWRFRKNASGMNGNEPVVG